MSSADTVKGNDDRAGRSDVPRSQVMSNVTGGGGSAMHEAGTSLHPTQVQGNKTTAAAKPATELHRVPNSSRSVGGKPKFTEDGRFLFSDPSDSYWRNPDFTPDPKSEEYIPSSPPLPGAKSTKRPPRDRPSKAAAKRAAEENLPHPDRVEDDFQKREQASRKESAARQDEMDKTCGVTTGKAPPRPPPQPRSKQSSAASAKHKNSKKNQFKWHSQPTTSTEALKDMYDRMRGAEDALRDHHKEVREKHEDERPPRQCPPFEDGPDRPVEPDEKVRVKCPSLAAVVGDHGEWSPIEDVTYPTTTIDQGPPPESGPWPLPALFDDVGFEITYEDKDAISLNQDMVNLRPRFVDSLLEGSPAKAAVQAMLTPWFAMAATPSTIAGIGTEVAMRMGLKWKPEPITTAEASKMAALPGVLPKATAFLAIKTRAIKNTRMSLRDSMLSLGVPFDTKARVRVSASRPVPHTPTDQRAYASKTEDLRYSNPILRQAEVSETSCKGGTAPKTRVRTINFSVELLAELLGPKWRRTHQTLDEYGEQIDRACSVIHHINIPRGSAVDRTEVIEGTKAMAKLLFLREQQSRIPFLGK